MTTDERRAQYIIETHEVQKLIDARDQSSKLRLVNSTKISPLSNAKLLHERHRLTADT